MLHALGDQADASPPFYYLVTWAWAKIFGTSDLALRLPSALCFGAGLMLLYRIVLRYFGAITAALVPAMCLCLCPIVRVQLAEARCFGLFFLLVVAAADLLLRASRTAHPGKALWIGMFLLNGCLVNVHVYGFAYSAALLGVSVCLWLATRRPSLPFAISFICGWVLFLPWVPSFLRQIDMTKPRVFLVKPKLQELWSVLTSELPIGLITLLLSGIVLTTLYVHLVAGLGERRGLGVAILLRKDRSARAFLTVGLLATALIAVVPIAWAFSVVKQPIFVSRYMLPSLVGWVLLIAGLLWRCLGFSQAANRQSCRPPAKRTSALLRAVPSLAVVGVVSAVSVAVVAWAVLARPVREISWDENIFPDKDLPVFFEEGTSFNQMRRYGQNPARFYIVLDWEASVKSGNVGSPLGYKIFSALRRNYDPGHIYARRDIPDSFQKFYFFAARTEEWFGSYLLHNSAYSVTKVAEASSGTVYVVERRGSEATPAVAGR